MGEATSVDLDDFSIVNHRLDLLDELRARIEGFKVTLFTVPIPEDSEFGESMAWLAEVAAGRPWVEFALHGWTHSYLECREWNAGITQRRLASIESSGLFVRGFKGPYWEMAPGVYTALRERGWWVADHDRNDHMRPGSLPFYKIDRPNRVHGHIQDIGSNGLAEAWATYSNLRGPFEFVSEVMTRVLKG